MDEQRWIAALYDLMTTLPCSCRWEWVEHHPEWKLDQVAWCRLHLPEEAQK